MEHPTNERQLLATAVALGAKDVRGWSPAETALTRDLPPIPAASVRDVRALILKGRDPLGQTFCTLRSPEERRPAGATYTPPAIVRAMLRWAAAWKPAPARIVDPGVGSARFLVAAGRRLADAELIGVELDPVAAIVARGHLAAAGFADRAHVLLGDYRNTSLPATTGRTAFLGNPPYVRHHLISATWKAWLTRTAGTYGLDASQLAGLHVHFFLATMLKAKAGDCGAFITAAEWLDVNYGRVLRDLFVGQLGGKAITLIEPSAQPFADAATTAAIACFEVGAQPRSIRLRRVAQLTELYPIEGGRPILRARLEAADRWTPLTRATRKGPDGYVELGELCRVHRGQVTGANKVWIAGDHSNGLPDSVLFPTVTKARELFEAAGVLRDPAPLRRVIDLPHDLDVFDRDERARIDRFLKAAKALGADSGYIARTRKAWWSVELRQAAPILATYMARRPPAFVRNLADARHINIAHGIYPREPLSDVAMTTLAQYLSRSVATSQGRTYAGGLTKFEPKEMERLLVPDLPLLNEQTATA